MTNLTIIVYSLQVIHKLDDENLRSRKFLHPSSYNKVTRECEQRMIADHLQFLHGECKDMVQKEKRQGIDICINWAITEHTNTSKYPRK